MKNPRQWFVHALGGGPTQSGVQVSDELALQLQAVWSCCKVLAEDIAALPLIVYRRLDDGQKERAPNHPLFPVLGFKPNSEMTRVQFLEALILNMGLRGNGYAHVVRGADGRARELWPLRSDHVQITRNDDGTLTYQWSPGASFAPGAQDSSVRHFTPEQILHSPLMSRDGVLGLSPITQARESIGLAYTAQSYGARLFQNDSRPGGVLKHPKELGEEARTRLQDSWRLAHEGTAHAHRVAVLEEGMEWQQVGISPEDSQFLETRKYQRTEIAGLYRVPPHMIGDLDHATFSNIEHQSIDYVKFTLLPWLVRLEMALKRDVFAEGEPFFAEFLVDGLLRGTLKERYEAHRIAHEGGWMNANEIRKLENMGPIPGGELYWKPSNMTDGTEPPPAPPPALPAPADGGNGDANVSE